MRTPATPLWAAALLAVGLTAPAWGQAVYNWNAANSGGAGGNGTAWIRSNNTNTTGANWLGGGVATGKMPGVDANNATIIDGTPTDVAAFNFTTANTTVVIGLSASAANNGLNGNGQANGLLSVGAIANVTNTGSFQLTLNASSVAPNPPGILQLNGAFAGNTAGLATNTLASATGGNIFFDRGTTNLLDMQLGINGGIFTAAAARAISISMNIGEAAGGAKGFTKDGAGTLTLTGTNTYTGATAVAAGTLRVTTTGSINATPTIAVAAGATYDVAGVTGGYTLGSAAAQTLQGQGAVTGGVVVAPGSTIRGDSGAGTGTLTVNNNVTLTGDASSGARLQAAVSRTAANTATASVLSLTGAGSVLNLAAGGNKFRIDLKNGATGPTAGETYTVTLASVAAAGNIKLNGTSQAANAVIADSNFDLTSSDFGIAAGYVLKIDATGQNLLLTFSPTPVPEPGAVFGLGAAVLGAGAAVRRLRRPAGQGSP